MVGLAISLGGKHVRMCRPLYSTCFVFDVWVLVPHLYICFAAIMNQAPGRAQGDISRTEEVEFDPEVLASQLEAGYLQTQELVSSWMPQQQGVRAKATLGNSIPVASSSTRSEQVPFLLRPPR